MTEKKETKAKTAKKPAAKAAPKKKAVTKTVKKETSTCNDPHCVVHGGMVSRGKRFTGTIIKDKMDKSVVVQRELVRYIPKYKRYLKSRSRLSVHNPKCISAKTGNIVRIAETRRISKTKTFVVTEILK